MAKDINVIKNKITRARENVAVRKSRGKASGRKRKPNHN